jgi:protein-tyrosine phosphatase
MFEAAGGKRAVAMRVATPWLVRTVDAGAPVSPVATPPRRVVFVCRGNICRSPYAEAAARRAGLDVISAGLDADAGRPANPVVARLAAPRGLDLAPHRARAVAEAGLAEGDLVLGFERAHLAELRARVPGAGAPGGPALRLAGAYAGAARWHLHDPYGLDERYVQRCLDDIDAAVAALVRHLAGAARGARG